MTTGAPLVKLFAWVIGVLLLLWVLVQCMGGPSPTADLDDGGAEQHAADCRRTWEALDLMGEADHENVDWVVDEIDELASEIRDPGLSAMTYAFITRTEDMIAAADPGDDKQLEDTYRMYRGLVEVDLSLRCSGASEDG